MAIRLAPLRIALADARWRGLELMVHQTRCLELAQEPRVLVEAPTGAGKTWAGAAPLVDAAIERGEGAIFVYPTNALADDQLSSLASILTSAGSVPGTVLPDGSVDVAGADVLLWRVHAGTIDDSKSDVGGRLKGQTLARVLERLPPKPMWLITNPDTLYLLCTARYSLSPQLWSRLDGARSLVLDEFHLYRGPTLVRALTMIALAEELLGVQRTRLLSATLPRRLREILLQRFGYVAVAALPVAEGRVVQHEVALCVDVAQGVDATERMRVAVLDHLPALRAERISGGVPLLVLRQSVLGAMALEDDLVEHGLDRKEIGVYRGLSSKAIRSIDGKTVVVGTSALEVGVDFRTSRLVFEALSAGSFAQRLGRVGRHEPGTALFFTDARVADALDRAVPRDRPALLNLVATVLALDDDLAGFACSPFGVATASAAFDALQAYGRSHDAPEAFTAAIEVARKKVLDGIGATEMPPLELMSRAARQRLSKGVGFRGGAGSVEVFDVRERDRRGSPELAVYEVDLVTFFRRAVWSGQPRDERRPVVTGYAAPRRLALGLDMTATAGVGLHAPKGDQLQLRVDGAATGWDVLLREHEHLVGLFPAGMRSELSWREHSFDSQDGRIALLDDDALIAGYIYWRSHDSNRVAVGGSR